MFLFGFLCLREFYFSVSVFAQVCAFMPVLLLNWPCYNLLQRTYLWKPTVCQIPVVLTCFAYFVIC